MYYFEHESHSLLPYVRTVLVYLFHITTENSSVWELVDHGTLWVFAYMCLRNILTN